jgi:hypothetical protein
MTTPVQSCLSMLQALRFAVACIQLNRMFMNSKLAQSLASTRWCFAALTLAALAACGGGGGDASAPSPSPASTVNTPSLPSAAAGTLKGELSTGLHHAWGYGYILNGVEQTFVSSTTVEPLSTTSARYDVVTKKIAGAVDSSGDAPSPFRFVGNVLFLDRDQSHFVVTTNLMELLFLSADSGTLSYGASSAKETWTVSLVKEDVSGKKVADFVVRSDGATLVSAALNTEAAFAQGDTGYVAKAVADQDMIVTSSLASPFRDVRTEADLFSAGFCSGYSSLNKTPSLGWQLLADGTLALYNTTDACDFSKAPALESGTWTKSIQGVHTIYALNYPASVKTGPLAPLFDKSAPVRALADVVVNLGTSGSFYKANVNKRGDTFTNKQHFFSASALPALKAAASIK